MSRSHPTDNSTANPSTRWFEWHGEKGVVRYYDTEAKQTVDVPLPFGFLLLDQLASIRGWHEASQSGIYSNEVRDTTQDVLVVKAFKAGQLYEGFYKQIKDSVNKLGGYYTANCYLAYKDEARQLAIGCLRLKGAALGAWMEFSKAHRSDLYSKAITITSYTEGKKGRVIYRVPTFQSSVISEESHHQAIALDRELQAYLTAYLARNKREQVDHDPPPTPPTDDPEPPPITDEDIPF
jgi:hypothetical protein